MMFGGSNVSHAIGGDLLAWAMTGLMALMIIATRRSAGASGLPIAAISSLASILFAAALAHPTHLHPVQLGELALFGITQLGLGLLLLTAGSKHLSASRVALIGGLDVPLAPIWVWLAFSEVPSASTIAGGLVVIVAVALNTRKGGLERQCGEEHVRGDEVEDRQGGARDGDVAAPGEAVVVAVPDHEQ